jgi:hypothetical protein
MPLAGAVRALKGDELRADADPRTNRNAADGFAVRTPRLETIFAPVDDGFGRSIH